MRQQIKMAAAGAAAGAANGLFGAGGGMILVPLLAVFHLTDEEEVFPSSVSIILPICVVSLIVGTGCDLPFQEALPYLVGGGIGGLLAGITGKKIPVKWLHRVLGIFVLWGGWRYLC